MKTMRNDMGINDLRYDIGCVECMVECNEKRVTR